MADSEMIAGQLAESSLTLVKEPKQADVNIIVTCTVKTSTSHRMIQRIKELTCMKHPLVIAGCMPKTERDLIESLNPSASLLGPEDLKNSVEVVTSTLKGVRCVKINGSSDPKLLFPRIRCNPVVGIVEISSGCLGNCAFCLVKRAKKKFTSYEPDLIKNEVKFSLQDGCKEIWLTSQDNGCYGQDIGTDLPSLLRFILEIKGEFKIRVGMMNPRNAIRLLEDLIPLYKDRRLFKFLHLPVQSGSDRVLNSMNRNHTVDNFLECAKRFKEEFPFATLSTDIIVGFPTEKEEDFQLTMKMIREVKPEIVHISRFGSRPGTESESMVQLSPQIVKNRSRLLHRVSKEIAFNTNLLWIGWKGEVLVDEEVREAVIGRNFAYRPVLIKENIHPPKVLFTEITSVTSTCLIGKVV